MLLAEARSRAADAGARVLHAVADATEARIPLAGARVLLARAGGRGLGGRALEQGLADPSADEVVHALFWLVADLAGEGPLALAVDDAQWADPLTVALLRTLARRADDLPLLLLVAARPGTLLGAERAFVRVEPGPLSAEGAAALLGRLAERAWELTRGNPLYLTELARAGTDTAPQRLVGMIEDRLARLGPDAAALARALAILGPDATAARARELAGLDRIEAAEQELRRERLVEDLAFVHPLVAEAARAGLDATLAADLHAHAATLLDDQTRIAEHLVHAPPRGDPSVVATLRRAAAAARRVGAPESAVRLLERAEAELPPIAAAVRRGQADPPPEAAAASATRDTQAEVASEAADSAAQGAQAEPPPEAAASATRGAQAEPSPDAAASAARGAQAAAPPDSDATQAVAFELARARLEASGDESGLVALAPRHTDAARQLARHYALSGRVAEAAAVLQAAPAADRETRLVLLAEAAALGAAVAPAPSPPRTPAELLLTVTTQIASGQAPDDPVDAARRLLALRLHRHFPISYAVGELTFSAAALLINGDALDDAEQAMRTLREDAEAAGQPSVYAGAFWQQAQIAYQRGDLARCESEARAAVETGGTVLRALADPWRVLALVERGQLEEAQALVPETIGPGGLMSGAIGSRGRLRLARGELDAAITDLTGARDRDAAGYRLRVEPPWRPWLAEALVLAGRTAEAEREAEAYAVAAAHWGTARAQGSARATTRSDRAA